MRLAKLLAQRGVASRRAAEEMIAAGVVRVNGQVAEVVTFVDPDSDVIEVRGQPIPGEQSKKYYALYKPKGYITGREDQWGRQSVLELAEHLPVRVEPVGRLDYDTEGILLLTNDGHLAHALTHPSREVPKRYRALAQGKLNLSIVIAIQSGVELDDGRTAPARASIGRTIGENTWIDVTVTEGRNRLIRRMMLKLGHPVLDLRRVSFAGITLAGMKRGEVRELSAEEVASLRGLAEGRPVKAKTGNARTGSAKSATKRRPVPGKRSRR